MVNLSICKQALNQRTPYDSVGIPSVHTSVCWWWLNVLRLGTDVTWSWSPPEAEVDGVAENLQVWCVYVSSLNDHCVSLAEDSI